MRKLYALVFSLTLWFAAQAQYATNGTASMLGPNHYLLTQAVNHSAGSVWNTTQVNLSNNFEINAQLYFGTVDDFADGIGFLLQSAGTTALGNTGAGLGYHGIAPSVVVEFDTYYNDFVSDIQQDHIGFMSNGSAYHADALQPPSPLAANPEDGEYHDVRFTWNAVSKTLTVNFMSGTYSYTGDIVNTHFSGNPLVYWGFTASTGSGPNEHRVRIISVTTTDVTPITITGNVTNAGCTGGAVDITVSGGVTPYSYSWSNGATTQDLGNVPAGSYTVTVTDGAGATKQATFTVGDNGCVQPITITGNVTNAGCTGGAVDITVSGGVSPYNYSWSNGATTQDLGNVPAGSYTVTVTDAAGTTKQASFTVGNNGCTTPITVTGNVTNASCSAGGSIDITVSGGTSPYTYSWSNGATTQDLNNVPAGSYTVTVTDAAGATKQASFTVQSGNDNAAPQLVCPATQTRCDNLINYHIIPELQASDNCGISSIKYVITGATSRSGNGKNASGVFNPGTSTITWTVKDNNGNTSTCTTQVIVTQVSVNIPDVYAVNPGGEANTIYIGYGPASLTLTANPSGGTGPYTYLWSTGATTKSITVNPNREGIYPYLVLVTDSKGCSAAMMKFIRVIDIRCGNNKVEICHVPAGKPSKSDEICVSKNAVEAHLAHGDYLGSCRSGRDNDNDHWRNLNAPADVTGETPAASPLNLRPNPSKGQFEVQLNSERTETARVMVLNSNGTVVESRTVQMTGKAQTLRFDLSRQASGIYLVKIVTGSGVRTEKVIIQK